MAIGSRLNSIKNTINNTKTFTDNIIDSIETSSDKIIEELSSTAYEKGKQGRIPYLTDLVDEEALSTIDKIQIAVTRKITDINSNMSSTSDEAEKAGYKEEAQSLANSVKNITRGTYKSIVEVNGEKGKKDHDAGLTKILEEGNKSEINSVSSFNPDEYISALYNTEYFKPYLCACVAFDSEHMLSKDNVVKSSIVLKENDIRPLFQSISGLDSPAVPISYEASKEYPLSFTNISLKREIQLKFLETNHFTVYRLFKSYSDNLFKFANKHFAATTYTKYEVGGLAIGFYDYSNIDLTDSNIVDIYKSNIVNNRLKIIGLLLLNNMFVKKVSNQSLENIDTTKADGLSTTTVTVIPKNIKLYLTNSEGQFDGDGEYTLM